MSERRAQSVVDYLISKGIPADKNLRTWYGRIQPGLLATPVTT
nr:hypothetical protein [Escherichia coli]